MHMDASHRQGMLGARELSSVNVLGSLQRIKNLRILGKHLINTVTTLRSKKHLTNNAILMILTAGKGRKPTVDLHHNLAPSLSDWMV
jgi:hypothetical protein